MRTVSDVRRPRILLVTRNLPPLVGGMERLNWHMAQELAKVADVRVIGPSGSAAVAPPGIVVREAPLRPLWSFLLRARALARREARAWQPDVVLAGSGLTAPLARAAARQCAAKAWVYVHGLDVAVRHPVYRAVWLRAIRRADGVIANSRATAELCRGIGVAPDRLGIVHPGVDLPAAPSSAEVAAREAAAFRSLHRLGAGPLLLSVGRLSTRKGLREFVAEALPRIVAAQPDAMLLVVGEAPSHALHAQAQTRESIQAVADTAGVGSHLCFLGQISDGQLSAVYTVADVHVFPIRSVPGDIEGFGMVAVEAAAHGLPTVAFATGGVVDAVAEGQSGRLVAPGDYAAFADAVLQVLANGEGAWRVGAQRFAERFAWPTFGVKLRAALKMHPVL